MHQFRFVTGVAALALVAGVSACADEGGDGGGSGADGELSYQDSPLNEYFAAAYGGDLSEEEMEKEFAEREAKVQEMVAECMAEEGFDYTPDLQSSSISLGSDEEWKPDDREWVAQYGYGAVNSPGMDRMEEMDEAAGEEYQDPNGDYVNSLSESEQQAYYETLHGAPPEMDDSGMPLDEAAATAEYSWEAAGCYGAAQQEVEGDQPFNDEEFRDLFDAVDELYTDFESSPEMTQINRAWSDCMAEAGHSGFETQWDAQESIYDKLNEFYTNNMPAVEEPESMDAAAMEEMEQAYQEAEAKMKEGTKGLAAEEVELALADLDCREETNYREDQLRVQFELEEQFVADHRTELDAFKAAAEQEG